MPLWVSGSKGVKSAFHIHPLWWYGLLRSGPSPRLLPKALKPVSAKGGRPRFRAQSSEMLQRLSGKLCQVQPPSAPARGCLSRPWSVFVSSFFSRGPNSTFTLVIFISDLWPSSVAVDVPSFTRTEERAWVQVDVGMVYKMHSVLFFPGLNWFPF